MDETVRIAALEAENGRLQERIEQLEDMMGLSITMPVLLGLTNQQARVLGAMLKRPACSKEYLLQSLYGSRAGDAPEIKIIDVFVCHLRRKLKPFGIQIETVWGEGYRLSVEMKARIEQLIAERAGA